MGEGRKAFLACAGSEITTKKRFQKDINTFNELNRKKKGGGQLRYPSSEVVH